MTIKQWGACALIGGFLVGCGGGGGGSSASTVSTILSGVAVDDRIIDGNVTIYRADTNATLVSGRTNTSGEYNLTIPGGYNGPIIVKITGDAATTMKDDNNNTVVYPSGLELRAVKVVSTGENVTAHVSFLSEMAAALALKAGNENNLSNAITDAIGKLETGELTGVPVKLTNNPLTSNVEKAVVASIRQVAKEDGNVSKIVKAITDDIKDGTINSATMKAVATKLEANATLANVINTGVLTQIKTSSYVPQSPATTDWSKVDQAKAMFKELRTQALSINDYKSTGTPGFVDKKAKDVANNITTMATPSMYHLSTAIDAFAYFDELATANNYNVNQEIVVVEVNGSSEIGKTLYYQYGSDKWYWSPFLELWSSNGIRYKITFKKTGTHSYSYTMENTSKNAKYEGTFSFNKDAIILQGDLPMTYWGRNAAAQKISVNVSGSLTTSGTLDDVVYKGTVKTYEENGTLGSTFTLTKAEYKVTNTTGQSTYEPMSFDGSFEVGTYKLVGTIMASNFKDVNLSGTIKHYPSQASFSGKATDTSDGSYISGDITANVTNANTIKTLDEALFAVTFAGKLNMPNISLVTVSMNWKDLSKQKATIDFSYLYEGTNGKTLISGTGTYLYTVTSSDTYSFDATLTNQVGIQVQLTGSKDRKSVTGSVKKDGTQLGTIDMLSTAPRVKYSDGTFETLY